MGVLASRIPGPVIRSEGLAGNDAVLEGATSEVGIVLERHDDGSDDDEDPSQTTNSFYPSKSCTIPKSGLILSYFPDWLIIRWLHFFCFCLFSFAWFYLPPKCIYT